MSESKKYKERLGKKVKDMTKAENREYQRLRKQDSRAGRTKGKAGQAPKNKKLNCAVMTGKGGGKYVVCNKVGAKKAGKKSAGGAGANRPMCRSGKAKRVAGGKTSGCGYNPALKTYGDRGDGKKVKRKPKPKKPKKAMKKQGSSDRTNEKQGMEIKGLKNKIIKPKKKTDIRTFYKKK